ncbi:MAG: hypothetical protein IIB61_01495 [Planctomycetes bacterium]|nr:hypothetical protein [Planctomycetota bacterium]
MLGKGDLFHWNVYSDIATQGGTLVETTTMPESNFTITQGTLTVNEFGNSVPYTSKLDDLSEHPIREIIHKVLKNDAKKSFDIQAHAQFNDTLMRMVPASSGTSTTAITLTTDGTATVTNTIVLQKEHVKLIVDLMKERDVPPYIQDDYVAIGWVSTWRRLKNDLESIHQYTEQGFRLIHNGEIGRYENVRFVEQTHIPKGGAADSSTWNASTGTADAWNTGVSDWAFFFGEDTVAEGIVKDYKILEKGDSAIGAKYCKIRAVISKDSIASTWGEVQNVLDQVGRPGILVFILERIDGVIQDSSILESKIEKRLLDAGFAVYSGAQVRAIAENESADAHMENNIAKVQALAKNFGTQIFIHGTAQANWAGVKDLYGTQTAMFNGDGMVKMFYTDTGQLLVSESLANWRGGARGINTHSPQAGKMALGNAGEELVDRVYISVMKRWATRISAGGEITLEVEGIKAGTAIKLKKKLAALPKVKRVNQRFSKGIATYRIVAKMTAEQLAEYLVEPEWESLIEIVDITLNRVQAKGVGN